LYKRISQGEENKEGRRKKKRLIVYGTFKDHVGPQNVFGSLQNLISSMEKLKEAMYYDNEKPNNRRDSPASPPV
jgi:hypothetical protein